MKKIFLLPLALVLGLGGAGAVMASDDDDDDRARAVQASTMLPASKIIAELEAKGFTRILEMELEDKLYEIKALDKDGRKVKIYVDPTTGQILP